MLWLGSSGVSSVIDDSAGEGDPDNYLCVVCSENLFGNYGCAENQASKFIRSLEKVEISYQFL